MLSDDDGGIERYEVHIQGDQPEGVTWMHVIGVGLVAGIGFTVSLFIAELAFSQSNLLVKAKIGILTTSIIAAVSGYFVLRRQGKRRR